MKATFLQKDSDSYFRKSIQMLSQTFGKPNIKLEFDPGLKYWAKRWIWTKIAKNFYKVGEKLNKNILPPQNENLEIVPWTTLGIPFGKIFTTRSIPSIESSLTKSLGASLFYTLDKWIPLATADLPQIPQNSETSMNLSYSSEFPIAKPYLPIQIKDHQDDLIGALALVGPFASYTNLKVFY